MSPGEAPGPRSPDRPRRDDKIQTSPMCPGFSGGVQSFAAQLVVEADTFGSQVRIRGKETNFYLCMTRRGKLVGKKPNNRSDDCVFVEKVLENNYTALMSARYKDWYVGFTKKGRPRRGPQTLPNQQDVHFMKRYPSGEQPDPQPFRFTTVSKRTKRLRTPSPR
nr:PREDICTED: fibroblast growth factor 18-like [Lepisosteus oculatus]